MHFSRMRAARLLTISRSAVGSARPPWMQIPPLDADTYSHVICDACWEANPPPVDRRNDTCL